MDHSRAVADRQYHQVLPEMQQQAQFSRLCGRLPQCNALKRSPQPYSFSLKSFIGDASGAPAAATVLKIYTFPNVIRHLLLCKLLYANVKNDEQNLNLTTLSP